MNLDHLPTLAADQVVMMSVAAGAVGRLPAWATDRVDRAVLGQPPEVAVDGRKADLLKPFVQFLRRERGLGCAERINDRCLLRGGAALGLCAVGRLIDNDSRFYYARADEASRRP